MSLKDLTFRDMMGHFLLTSVFLFAIISFAVGIGDNYGKGSEFATVEHIDVAGIQNTIEETNAEAEKWEKVFKSDNLFVALGGIILFSLWGIINLIWTSVFGIFNLIIQIASDVLGLPAIVVSTFVTLLILTLIFLAWRTLKAGE